MDCGNSPLGGCGCPVGIKFNARPVSTGVSCDFYQRCAVAHTRIDGGIGCTCQLERANVVRFLDGQGKNPSLMATCASHLSFQRRCLVSFLGCVRLGWPGEFFES